MKKFFLSSTLIISLACFSQNENNTTTSNDWFNLDQQLDKSNGLGTERVYRELLKGKKSTTVIVGVIDSGVDIEHEDLKDIIWTNKNEIPGNGLDDDRNGYIDDIHGWNFIGGANGKNINYERLEMVRIYKELDQKYNGKNENEVKDKDEYKLYLEVKEKTEKEIKKVGGQLNQINFIFDQIVSINKEIKSSLNIEKVKKSTLLSYKSEDVKKKQMIGLISTFLQDDNTSLDDFINELSEGKEYLDARMRYNLNPDYDQRMEIVGDDENNPYEKYYGNNDVKGEDPGHGTHVSGIIGAIRNNNIGINGIADNVRIMPIRAVPNGDERDKDIANAIYYAVDMGCHIINMSFGKTYVKHKDALEKAIKYAESKGVLMVHAAGNESTDIDVTTHYPTKRIKGSKKGCKNWIEVGALSWKTGLELPASFSNYGKKTVDVFAPGVDIYSTFPGNKYKKENGTSMACPATAGAAALLKSYFPQLTSKDIKSILEKTVNKSYKKTMVKLPISGMAKDKQVEFSELSKTGGFINLFEAVKLAMKKTGMKS
ncbi:MAG: S8 family serine peptidase [Bacteroidota bacterium]